MCFLKDCAALTMELHQNQEKLRELTEEVKDMKSERTNTRVSSFVQFFLCCYADMDLD